MKDNKKTIDNVDQVTFVTFIANELKNKRQQIFNAKEIKYLRKVISDAEIELDYSEVHKSTLEELHKFAANKAFDLSLVEAINKLAKERHWDEAYKLVIDEEKVREIREKL